MTSVVWAVVRREAPQEVQKNESRRGSVTSLPLKQQVSNSGTWRIPWRRDLRTCISNKLLEITLRKNQGTKITSRNTTIKNLIS